ncbi:esterase [Mangrovihabitans endophyticus]|uniref:Esterase n=2 Tax=Mangrovihabitans endophyticus TaxID=1751298 RepID=A0A8J3C2D4_9ACTN|nr:esterase [Mangrovihabitans endophyticus]
MLAGGAAAAMVVGAVAGREWLGHGPGRVLPDVPAGDERLETRRSAARGVQVDFWTAVPAGHGDGRGLPVCLVLHGASATAADFPGFGFARYLTAAVRAGAAPFVLAGATGGVPHNQRMWRAEVPVWCGQRGFDTSRTAVWGWSMGGHGALSLAVSRPQAFRGVAAFAPAVRRGDDVFDGADRLRDVPVRLWCGLGDGFADNVWSLERALPDARASYGRGGHNFDYWSACLPAAFAFLGGVLTRA